MAHHEAGMAGVENPAGEGGPTGTADDNPVGWSIVLQSCGVDASAGRGREDWSDRPREKPKGGCPHQVDQWQPSQWMGHHRRGGHEPASHGLSCGLWP